MGRQGHTVADWRVVDGPWSGAASLPFRWTSIEQLYFTPGPASREVNLWGDNNDTVVDQTDTFRVTGRDVDSTFIPLVDLAAFVYRRLNLPIAADPRFETDPDGDNEFFLTLNSSPPVGFRNVAFLNVRGWDGQTAVDAGDGVDTLDIRPYADATPQGWGLAVTFDEGNPVDDGVQADLLIYRTSANGGAVSEAIVVQPAGPGNGQVVATNAAFGTPIVAIDFAANQDLIVVDDDGAASDTDTLTLRGTNADQAGASGREEWDVDFGAAGDPTAPFVTVTDTASSAVLYRLLNTFDAGGVATFFTVTLDSLGGVDVFHVTPNADVALMINGGTPTGKIPGQGDVLDIVPAAADALTYSAGPEADAGQFVAGHEPADQL